MNHSNYHLAQYNIINLIDEIDSPTIKEFKDFLAPVNKLAEDSTGFVWRLKDEGGTDATDIETPYEDKLVFINMSVWVDIASLKSYSYQTVHSYFLKSRKKWSTQMAGHQAVMWWIPAGHIPSILEAKEKLDILNQNGPSAEAFSMTEHYDQNGIKL